MASMEIMLTGHVGFYAHLTVFHKAHVGNTRSRESQKVSILPWIFPRMSHNLFFCPASGAWMATFRSSGLRIEILIKRGVVDLKFYGVFFLANGFPYAHTHAHMRACTCGGLRGSVCLVCRVQSLSLSVHMFSLNSSEASTYRPGSKTLTQYSTIYTSQKICTSGTVIFR